LGFALQSIAAPLSRGCCKDAFLARLHYPFAVQILAFKRDPVANATGIRERSPGRGVVAVEGGSKPCRDGPFAISRSCLFLRGLGPVL
jgi:hypothetical protein